MSPEHLAELVDRHAAALSLYARQWCACPDDVVQTAFLKLARQRIDPDNPLAWLFKVVRTASLAAARAARRRHKHEGQLAESRPDWFLPPDDPTGMDARAAAQALSGLPAEMREITVMHLWGGLTFEEIAAAVGGSASTCYRRYAAGLNLLREKLSVPCPTR
jgi:RNA polymerase sigma factor (sigma-70 family)